jgi:hypothetical protein
VVKKLYCALKAEMFAVPVGIRVCSRCPKKKLLSSHQAHDKTHDGHHRKNEEKNFRDLYSTGSDTAKPEYRSNQGDHQEDDGIVKHLGFLALSVVIGVPSETPAARLRKSPFFSHRLRRCGPVSTCVRTL